MIWGFTGSRYGSSNEQLAWLYQTLEDNRPNAIHHGACQGADHNVHLAALHLDIPIHVWPPTNPKWLAEECLTPHKLVTVHHAMPYMPRNREIVRHAEVVKALPRQETQPDLMEWGDTWYTVDFARRVFKPVDICYPSGRVESRRET